MENTLDSFMSGPLLFCMKIEKSVYYSVPDNKYWTGQHNEVPKSLSLKRNADLPLLRKNAPAQTGLQEENPMAL